MINYFIGIDGGATKSVGRLLHGHKILGEMRSGPSTLSHQREQSIANLQKLCIELIEHSDLEPGQISLACGIAGAGNPEAAQELKESLVRLGFAAVTVTTDAQTSLVGAGDGKPLVMVAVGTGSVAMRLDSNGFVKQFGGWGLAVGDEGSGAAIGKSAVRALLWELDIHGEPISKLSRHVVECVGRQRPAILRWLSQAGPLEYAALAPVVFDFLPHCELAKNIAQKTAREVEVLIRAASGDFNLPLALLGGLAQNLSGLLSQDIQARLMQPLGTSLDGACKLAQQSQRFL